MNLTHYFLPLLLVNLAVAICGVSCRSGRGLFHMGNVG
jgi:hypothetical protein